MWQKKSSFSAKGYFFWKNSYPASYAIESETAIGISYLSILTYVLYCTDVLCFRQMSNNKIVFFVSVKNLLCFKML